MFKPAFLQAIRTRDSSVAHVPNETQEPQLAWFLIGVTQFPPLLRQSTETGAAKSAKELNATFSAAEIAALMACNSALSTSKPRKDFCSAVLSSERAVGPAVQENPFWSIALCRLAGLAGFLVAI